MAAKKILCFPPETPPEMAVRFHVSRVQRFPRQKIVQVWGHVGDYEVAIHCRGDQIPDGQTRMQVTQIFRYGRDKTVQVSGYVGDYEVAIPLSWDDDHIKCLVRLHKRAKYPSITLPGS